jgi:hypothetical protein
LACSFEGKSFSMATSLTSLLLRRGSSWRWTARITRVGVKPIRAGTARSAAGLRVLRLPASLVTRDLAAALHLVRRAPR